jgi:hypothetical protein
LIRPRLAGFEVTGDMLVAEMLFQRLFFVGISFAWVGVLKFINFLNRTSSFNSG